MTAQTLYMFFLGTLQIELDRSKASASFRYRRHRPPFPLAMRNLSGRKHPLYLILSLQILRPAIHQTVVQCGCVLSAACSGKPALWVHTKTTTARVGGPLLFHPVTPPPTPRGLAIARGSSHGRQRGRPCLRAGGCACGDHPHLLSSLKFELSETIKVLFHCPVHGLGFGAHHIRLLSLAPRVAPVGKIRQGLPLLKGIGNIT